MIVLPKPLGLKGISVVVVLVLVGLKVVPLVVLPAPMGLKVIPAVVLPKPMGLKVTTGLNDFVFGVCLKKGIIEIDLLNSLLLQLYFFVVIKYFFEVPYGQSPTSNRNHETGAEFVVKTEKVIY